MNPLNEYPKVRKAVYTAFWVIGLLLGAFQVGYSTIGSGTPSWVAVALAVLAYVSIVTNYTASQNVVEDPPQGGAAKPLNERGLVENSVLVTILCIVVIIAAVLFIASRL